MSDTMNRDALAKILPTHGTPPPELVFKKGAADYVGHGDITAILIKVDPCWSWEPQAWAPDGGPLVVERGGRLVLWGWMTVHGKRLPCVGTFESKMVGVSRGKNGPPEVDKELIGNLIRNGAMRFGIGLNLWTKADWAEPDDEDAPRGATEIRPVSAPVAPEPVWDEARWLYLAKRLRGLPDIGRNAVVGKLTNAGLFKEAPEGGGLPCTPFTDVDLDAIEKLISSDPFDDGPEEPATTVEVPDDGLEDWQRELALVEDVAAFDWKKAAGKLIPLRPVPLFKMAKEAAARIGADEPHDLGSIDGAVGQELVLALIDLQPPF